MPELEAWTADELRARFAAASPEPAGESLPADISEGRWAYREAAALMGSFQADSLVSDGKPDATLAEFIAADCRRVRTAAGERWGLVPAVREEAVRRLSDSGRLVGAAQAVKADPIDTARTMAVQYLLGSAPPIDEQSPDQLLGTLQSIEWLAPTGTAVPVALPSPDDVRGRLPMASLLAPLRKLAGRDFVGRNTELARLSNYVEVLPPGSRRSSTGRRVRRVLHLTEKPPLVICGPGGIGKSTVGVPRRTAAGISADEGRVCRTGPPGGLPDQGSRPVGLRPTNG